MNVLDRLTERQREVLDFIRDKIDNRGYGPTIREVGTHFGINSPNGVLCHFKALEKKGLIIRDPNMARAIEITDEGRSDDGIPIVGRLGRGGLETAIADAGRLVMKEWAPSGRQVFAMRVRGDSMIDAAIADGDIIICKRTKVAYRGDIVLVLLKNGDATLRYWFPEANRVRLQPANSSMKPIYGRDLDVLGIVTHVVRRVA